VIEEDLRTYYIEQRFNFLKRKIETVG